MKRIGMTLLLLIFSPLWAYAKPQVWFCPLDPAFRAFNKYPGSPQYMDLFSRRSKWEKAASHVDVFKIYPTWIATASDDNLRKQFADLKRRHIALALEFGPLTNSSNCSQGILGEGSMGPSMVAMVRRIFQEGGNLRYVAMDEPAYYSMYGTCHWSPQQTAANAAVNIRAVLAEFPQVKFGDIEPIGGAAQSGLTDEVATANYQAFIEAFKKQLGFPLAFFDADTNWNSPDLAYKLLDIQQMLRGENVPFGIIYDGLSPSPTDADWIHDAEQHMSEAEEITGTPDDVIFQSWEAHPDQLLPEDSSSSFTWLINQYFRPRTILNSRF